MLCFSGAELLLGNPGALVSSAQLCHVNNANNQNLFSVLLYFTSSAAQVWTALLVFQIFLIRDKLREWDHQFKALWSDAKDLWKDFQNRVADPNATGIGHKLREFDLTPEEESRADNDRQAFLKVMNAICKKQMIASFSSLRS